jgi:hypothetical protein
MRYVLTFLFSLVLAVGLTGCDSNDNGGPGPTAQVRFMHASPGAGPVNVVVDGDEALSNVSFSSDIASPTVSDYQDVPVSADASIEVQDADGNTVLSTTAGEANLQEDNQYTIIVAGTPGASNAPQAIVLRDQFRDDLGDGEIGLRLVHGAATPGAVDIYLNDPNTDLTSDEVLIQDFQFGDDFPGQFPGQFAAQGLSSEGSVLVVTPAGSTTRVLELPVGGDQGSLGLQAGQHVTGVAIDAPGSESPAGALIHIDNPGS